MPYSLKLTKTKATLLHFFIFLIMCVCKCGCVWHFWFRPLTHMHADTKKPENMDVQITHILSLLSLLQLASTKCSTAKVSLCVKPPKPYSNSSSYCPNTASRLALILITFCLSVIWTWLQNPPTIQHIHNTLITHTQQNPNTYMV